MTTTETIIYLFGTGIGGAILGKSFDKWMNKKKDAIEVELKEQVFYKNLISDMRAQRNEEHEEMEGLKSQIKTLTNKVEQLVKGNKDKDGIIEGLKRSNARWEEAYIRLEQIANQKDNELNKYLGK
jgi:hypothetical protein